MTARSRLASLAGFGFVVVTTLAGCFGTPFDKGDNPGAGTGTGRPQPGAIDMTRTGGLGATRGNVTIGPGELGTRAASAPAVGPK